MLTRQGAVYHFRRKVPVPLRRLVGRAEIWASLRTSNPTVARARAGLLYAAVQDLFETATRMSNPAAPSDDEERQLEAAIREEERQIDQLRLENDALQAKTALLRARMTEIQHNEEVITRTQAAMARLPTTRDGVVRLTGRLDEARHQGRRAEQLVTQLAEAAARTPKAPDPAPAQPPKPLASELVEPFFERRATRDKATHQVMGQERGTLRRFVEYAGDRPIDTYGRGDITGFLDILRLLPATYGKSPKDKDRSLTDLIAEADANEAKRLTDKTVKRHLSTLSQFFHFAVDKEHLTVAARTEMIDGHRFRTERGARDQRDAWTPEELSKLFTSPVWTGCRSKARRAEPGEEIIKDARFWLPILALYHGARLEEFADLYRRDVFRDGATWAIRIIESEEEGAGQRKRRLKTLSARRVVPLHPELVRLGFLDYVERTAPREHDPLFPDILPQGPDGKRGPRVTRWFVEYRRAVGVYREGVGMHAFRHTAITRLSDAIETYQQKRHRDCMMGHGGGGTEGDVRYDKGAGLAAAAATLALLRYPEVDLSHLYIRDA